MQVPVPQALCLCQDALVIGTPFYVMSFVGGRVYDDLALPELVPADRHQVICAAVEMSTEPSADVSLHILIAPALDSSRNHILCGVEGLPTSWRRCTWLPLRL
jgi:hypothetical protein